MARRLVSEHFQANGKPKRAFKTFADTVPYLEPNSDLMSYRCSFCGDIHIGHPKKIGEKRKRGTTK